MKLIDSLRKNTIKGIKLNKEKEYKKCLDEIKNESKDGRFNCKFSITLYYENIDDIYMYIIDKLHENGIHAEIERYGFQLSHKRLFISWDDKYIKHETRNKSIIEEIKLLFKCTVWALIWFPIAFIFFGGNFLIAEILSNGNGFKWLIFSILIWIINFMIRNFLINHDYGL